MLLKKCLPGADGSGEGISGGIRERPLCAGIDILAPLPCHSSWTCPQVLLVLVLSSPAGKLMWSPSALLCRFTLLFVFLQSYSLLAQRSSFGTDLEAPSTIALQSNAVVLRPEYIQPGEKQHFWDSKNTALFAAVASLAAGDFFVTRANLSSGGHELNPVARVWGRSSAGLALNFSLEAGAVILTSYCCHRKGHHRIERLPSVINVAGSAAAVFYGLAHR
jgi:hypothetical protein